MRRLLCRSWIRAIRVSAALAALYATGELAALKAAGFTGQVPVGGKVIKESGRHASEQLGMADRHAAWASSWWSLLG